jgi:cell surface protein SprA
VISLASAFKPNRSNNSNVVFDNFLNYRRQIAQTLKNQTPGTQSGVDSAGFPIGYSRTHQDVLIPAFLKAYTGQNVGTNEFPQIPMPNWSINYTGLSNYAFFKSFAKQVSLTSGYHSTYTVTNYSSNLGYAPGQFDTFTSNSKNYISKYRIDGVTISERFDPLIGIDMTLKNNWSGSLSYGKQRQESLTFIDQRITENKTTTITVGVGYVTNKFYLPFQRRGHAKRYLKNELKFRLDVQINQNEQQIWILDQPVSDPTGGQLIIAILPNVTYTLNKNLTVNIFLKQNMTTPYTSNQYPTSLTSIGFSLKYILTP